MNYYIGTDLGTSALKLILCDSYGSVLRTVTKEYDVYYPNAGWSEQNPEDWWNAFEIGISELVTSEYENKICGIGVAGQMHGLVILDEHDEVIRPAILWNDGRCDKETDYLNTAIGKEKLSDYSANIAFAGFTAPKILWLQNNEPENFAKIKKIMLPKDYINYRLTGVHCTDFSDASGMLLLDVKNRCWSAEMLEICGVDKSVMPVLFESCECVGAVKADISQKLKLGTDVKVAAGAGDNAGAAIGMATVGDGKCNISLGTSGTVFISAERFSVDNNNALHSFCHADGTYHLMGCILSAASCNKWFCDKVLECKDYDSLQKNINDDMLGSGDVFFLPYLMGERSPINDTNATGMFIGLRPDTDSITMLLAVLEGVCFAIKDNMRIAERLGIKIRSSTVCGGGAKSKLWMKILANVLGFELALPEAEEGPGYGAVKLAMVASGEYGNLNDCVNVKIKDIIIPDSKLVELYEKKYEKYRKIYPHMKNLYRELKEDM